MKVEFANEVYHVDDVDFGDIVSMQSYSGNRMAFVVGRHPANMSAYALTKIDDGNLWSSNEMTKEQILVVLNDSFRKGKVHTKAKVILD